MTFIYLYEQLVNLYKLYTEQSRSYTEVQLSKYNKTFEREHGVIIENDRIIFRSVLINGVHEVGNVKKETIKVDGLLGKKEKDVYIVSMYIPDVKFTFPYVETGSYGFYGFSFSARLSSKADKLQKGQSLNILGKVDAYIRTNCVIPVAYVSESEPLSFKFS